jgi:uncharacterized protein
VSALFVSMFALGLATSVHCISMCGPMVVTYAVKGEEDEHWTRKITPNLAYQLAKITSYVLVGLLLGAIGAAFNLNGIRPWIMFAAGVFMIILGLGMTGRFPWAARMTPRPPKFLITSLSKLRRKAKSDAEVGISSIATPISFGLLTGLMPCAPLQAAQLAAAGTGSVIGGGVAMLAFGLGTAPLMLGFGMASSFIPKDWKHRMTVALAIVVMVFGLVYINRAAMLVGSPVTFNTIKAAAIGGGASASKAPAGYTTAADGVVEVPLAIINTQYVPATVSIPADKPVRLIVDRQENAACSNQLVLPQLGISVPLADNAVTAVDIPATKAGTYSMTCGMGMMSGTLVVGTVGKSGVPGSPILWLTITLVATATAIYVARRNEKAVPAKGARKPAPAATVLGFTPVQLALVVGGVAAAVIVGLAFGGFFS